MATPRKPASKPAAKAATRKPKPTVTQAPKIGAATPEEVVWAVIADDELGNDHMDGCDLDFRFGADDEDTAALRALFPDGVHVDYGGLI